MLKLLNLPPPSLALAPMAGVTDVVFRDICRDLGADYAVSEMVASKKELWQSVKSSSRHASAEENSPKIVQLLGTNADELSAAAIWQESKGADIIDLNMGCPAKKVCDVAAGSALMANPKLVEEIFLSLVNSVQIPVTVKIRTGSDINNINALQIAKLAEKSGLQSITIHGRTRADKFNGKAEYDTIKQVKQTVILPVIANGDICSPQQAEFVLKYTNADGLMIGRAAQGYPWIFREISYYLKTGKELNKPTLSEFKTTINKHLLELYNLYGEQSGYRIARKHLGWYSHYLPKGEELRREFNRLESSQKQMDLIGQYFEQHK